MPRLLGTGDTDSEWRERDEWEDLIYSVFSIYDGISNAEYISVFGIRSNFTVRDITNLSLVRGQESDM